MKTPIKTCVFVLGMHRSGTSALSGTLNKLGFYLGKELIKEYPDNIKGFFENKDIVEFNKNKLLPFYNSSWSSIGLLPEKWYEQEK